MIRRLLSCTFGLLLVPLGSQVAFAQQREHALEISGLAGYQVATPTFDGSTSGGFNALVKMAASPSYGVVLGRLLRPGVRSELSWRFEPTHLTSTLQDGSNSSSQTDLAMHYFTVAASYEGGSQRVKVFALAGMGAMLAHPEAPSAYGDEWFLSFALGLGLKMWLNEHLGLRVESRLEVPVRFSSGGMWCINGACAVTSSGARAFAQVDFVGGPVVAF
jgi:opacity protein-like surface antigen